VHTKSQLDLIQIVMNHKIAQTYTVSMLRTSDFKTRCQGLKTRPVVFQAKAKAKAMTICHKVSSRSKAVLDNPLPLTNTE